MEYAYSNGNVMQDEMGQWAVKWDMTMPGAKAFPEEIHIHPQADFNPEIPPTDAQASCFTAFSQGMRFIIKEDAVP